MDLLWLKGQQVSQHSYTCSLPSYHLHPHFCHQWPLWHLQVLGFYRTQCEIPQATPSYPNVLCFQLWSSLVWYAHHFQVHHFMLQERKLRAWEGRQVFQGYSVNVIWLQYLGSLYFLELPPVNPKYPASTERSSCTVAVVWESPGPRELVSLPFLICEGKGSLCYAQLCSMACWPLPWYFNPYV